MKLIQIPNAGSSADECPALSLEAPPALVPPLNRCHQ